MNDFLAQPGCTLHPVASSNIASLGFRPTDNGLGTLYVQFQSSPSRTVSTYAYADVPEDLYQALRTATSCGQYFARHIKGVYPFVKAED